MNPADATREILWNSGNPVLLYAGAAVAVFVLLGGLVLRAGIWMRGRKDSRPGGREDFRILLHAVATAKGLIQGRYHIGAHQLIVGGMTTLLAGTVLEGGLTHLGSGFLVGPAYLLFKVTLEIAGVAVLLGVGRAVYERYILRLKRLENRPRDAVQLVLLGAVVVSGFMVEGARIAATADPWGFFSPIGSIFAAAWRGLGSDRTTVAHQVLWYGHIVIALGVIALAPWTKLLHAVAVPLNVLQTRPFSERHVPSPVGDVAPSSDVARVRGAGTLAGSSRKQLIEVDACAQCGRCRTWCSICRAGIADSPMSLLEGARRLLLSRSWDTPLVGTALSAEGLWACTMCRTCEDHCVMWGEHVVRCVDLRRSEVGSGEVPAHVSRRFAEIESRFVSRPAEIQPVTPSGLQDGIVHIWPGCRSEENAGSGALTALTRLISDAGLTPVLLRPPACCGSPARRLGNEDLYLRSAAANIAYLDAVMPSVVVTPCPHCFTTLTQEYLDLGARINVIHHTRFLADLLGEGRLTPQAQPGTRAVYHDPCYLSRYSGEVSAPREVLGAVPGLEIAEIPRHNGRKSFCCGSGGGTTSAEVADANGRLRVRQALESGADTLITACPYCRDNLAQAASEEFPDRLTRVVDIAEVLLGSGTASATEA